MLSPYNSCTSYQMPASKRRDEGFTLLELLIVITIMGLGMAIIPSASAGLSAWRLRYAAFNLAETLRDAHQDAMMKGIEADVVIDRDQRTYGQLGHDVERLPAIVRSFSFEREGVPGQLASTEISFFPDGSSTGGTLLLRSPSRSISVVVDWLTGRTRVLE